MATRGMRIAKATPEDFEGLRDFRHFCEGVLEKQRFSLRSPEDNWEEWDDDDEDKQWILKMRKEIAEEEGIEPEDVDIRIVLYECLKRIYRKANGWYRVTTAADVLIDNVCDPQKDYLDYRPSLEEIHVAPEQ